MIETIKVYTIPRCKSLMDIFYSKYQLVNFLESPPQKIKHKPQNQRRCRFCGKAYQLPLTRFQKDAHILPEFLGNKYLTSDFECDNCNEKFSRYENDLKNYLGIIPSVTKTIGKKNKLSKFKSPGEEITAGITDKLPIEGNFIEIFKNAVDSDALKIDFEQGKANIQFKKNPFVPYNVYKAFLKIGISCLPSEEVKHYGYILNALQKIEALPVELAKIHVTYFQLTLTTKEPFIYLFSKRNTAEKIPTHVFVLYYQNMIFQFYLPLHLEDFAHVYQPGHIDIPVCPPMFSQKVEENIETKSELVDFSSTISVKSEVQHMSFQFAIDPDKMVSRNPTTGEITKSVGFPKEIMGFILTPAGTVISNNKVKE